MDTQAQTRQSQVSQAGPFFPINPLFEDERFCVVCQESLTEIIQSRAAERPIDRTWSASRPHHTTIESIHVSVRDRCYICTIFYENAELWAVPTTRNETEMPFSIIIIHFCPKGNRDIIEQIRVEDGRGDMDKTFLVYNFRGK
jgi:hypothetical protein